MQVEKKQRLFAYRKIEFGTLEENSVYGEILFFRRLGKCDSQIICYNRLQLFEY